MKVEQNNGGEIEKNESTVDCYKGSLAEIFNYFSLIIIGIVVVRMRRKSSVSL